MWTYEEYWHCDAILIGSFFGDADGRAAAERIDRRIDRLPGLAGLRLVTAAAA